MSLFDLFKKKEAATFAAEPINPTVLPGPEDCNCADIFLGDKAFDERIEVERTGDKRAFNKKISGFILSTLFDGDRQTSRTILGKMKRTQPVANESEEFKRHMLGHFDAAGINHRDLGFKDSDLSPQYIAGRELATKVQDLSNAAEAREYSGDNCGTCGSYLTSLKMHAHKFKESLESKAEKLEEPARSYSKLNVRGLFQRAWDSWTGRQPVKNNDHPMVAEGNEILKAWNKHTEQAHNASLDPYAFLKNTPVVDDRSGARLDTTIRESEGLTRGWSEVRRSDLPAKDISPETAKTLEETFPPQNIYENLFAQSPEISAQKASDIAKQMELKGELANEIIPATNSLSQPQVFVTTQNVTGVGRGPNFTLQRKPIRTEVAYDPAEAQESWSLRPMEFDGTGSKLINAGDPGERRWIPNTRATDRPEIVQTWTNHQHEGRCDHADHGLPPTQRPDETDDDFKKRQLRDSGLKCSGWHPDDISDLYTIPREDAYLFQKARVKPDLLAHKTFLKDKRAYEAIPKLNRPQVAPSPARANANYTASYAKALAIAYPDISDVDEARWALRAEHQAKVNELESATERYRTSSKRTFNSKKVCQDCGKDCKDKVECKKNQDDARRERAADSAY